MALTDEQEAALRAELASLSGELATIARVNELIQRAHARHEAEERQKDDEIAALRARLASLSAREQVLQEALEFYGDVEHWGWHAVAMVGGRAVMAEPLAVADKGEKARHALNGAAQSATAEIDLANLPKHIPQVSVSPEAFEED